MLVRVGLLSWGPGEAQTFPSCSMAPIPKREPVSLAKWATGNGPGALGQSRHCCPWPTAASVCSHLLLVLRQQLLMR